MKRLVYASEPLYESIEVVPEANDEDDNPCCWALKFFDESGNRHYVWISKYDEKEYVVEDSNGNDLGNGPLKTLTGAKNRANEVIRKQIVREIFTN